MNSSGKNESKMKIGVSTCLLGENVRWNGGHARSRFVTDVLARYVEFVPVCPEVEAGFPVPRETFRLIGQPDEPRLVTTRTGVDHTDRMKRWARSRAEDLAHSDLCGFIFKKDSPNSGMKAVKVYGDKGVPVRKGVGIFARAFMERHPLIPVEEDGRLNDLQLRENFIEAIFTLKRWRDMRANGPWMGRLVEFHTREKLLVLAHSPEHYRDMGRLVARGKSLDPTALHGRYAELLMNALRLKATVKKHINVMQHIMGYFKNNLSGDEKQELLEILDRYRRELVPLIVPITLLNHYVRKYEEPYLARQTYLNPHPVELKLRNHA